MCAQPALTLLPVNRTSWFLRIHKRVLTNCNTCNIISVAMHGGDVKAFSVNFMLSISSSVIYIGIDLMPSTIHDT